VSLRQGNEPADKKKQHGWNGAENWESILSSEEEAQLQRSVDLEAENWEGVLSG
jgi:hypothetical protein